MTLESTIKLQKRLAPLHLISASLIAGVIIFAGVALTTGPIGSSPGGTTSAPASLTSPGMPMIMRMVWAGLAFMQIPVVFVIRGASISRAAAMRRSDVTMITSAPPAPQFRGAVEDESAIHVPTFDAFRNASIVGFALLESVALIGAMAVMFSGDPVDLALVAVPVAAMLATFPTTGRWRNFDRAVQERAAVLR